MLRRRVTEDIWPQSRKYLLPFTESSLTPGLEGNWCVTRNRKLIQWRETEQCNPEYVGQWNCLFQVSLTLGQSEGTIVACWWTIIPNYPAPLFSVWLSWDRGKWQQTICNFQRPSARSNSVDKLDLYSGTPEPWGWGAERRQMAQGCGRREPGEVGVGTDRWKPGNLAGDRPVPGQTGRSTRVTQPGHQGISKPHCWGPHSGCTESDTAGLQM